MAIDRPSRLCHCGNPRACKESPALESSSIGHCSLGRVLFLSHYSASVCIPAPALDAKRPSESPKLLGGRIHLLLTDVIMPEMGGKQLAEQMAGLRPATKVLYMSGYSDDGIVRSGILATEMVFLEKPFRRDILLRKVRRILDEASQRV